MSNLAVLQESLGRSEKMKDNMLSILTTFEKRLKKLEDTIMPIYQETGNLQRRHENIEKTVAVLDHVIGYYNVAEDVEPVMRDGPSTNLALYIESLNRLTRAVKFLVHNNPGSPTMAHVIALYDAGKESLEKEFHNLLSQCNKPIQPIQLIESVSNEEDEKASSSSLSPRSSSASLSSTSLTSPYNIVYYNDEALNKLKVISIWLLESKYEVNLVQYYVKSSSSSSSSITSLKSHLRVVPIRENSATLIVGGGMSQSPSVKGKLRETPKKTLKRGVVTKASSFLKKQQDHAAYRPVNVGLKDENFEAESSLMTQLIPEKSRSRIYDHLLLITVDFLNREAEGCKALEEFVDSIRNDPDKSSMPKDGTVHELTSNAMFFMEQLLEYSDVVGCMLMFQAKVLSALGLNLSNKTECYNDVALRAIFMLNNFNYVLNLMKRSGMMDVIHLWNSEVQLFYEEQINNQKRLYSQCWSGVLHFISENQRPISTDLSPDSRLKDKDRNAIKEKFAGFNKELEDICRQQKSFSVPDPELKQALIDDNRSFVLPFYSAFLKKYRNVSFTKNPEKYMKYSEEDVARCIVGLFDASA
ncbi:hypothetical protein HELRODRAFT_159872 [Helobdella robusta]|uniref:Exocyst complex component 7 n=1 Tax=Helobdella robusta TaxID=6412 RepID=T1EPH3_HELRO|nr:hypothetical protein HELRODRAFT_159872 [Helobdella robusta]ESO13234.1 hypothetical protein HELRODRAFT_159872 [Helobdella robusta]